MPKRLLVVDDSLVSRMMTRDLLSKLLPDWEVVEAASGQEAILLCRQQAIERVCMDINMPGISGLDAAQAILRDYPATRIAILTANVQEAMQRRIAQLGLAFVAKPIGEQRGAELLKALGE